MLVNLYLFILSTININNTSKLCFNYWFFYNVSANVKHIFSFYFLNSAIWNYNSLLDGSFPQNEFPGTLVRFSLSDLYGSFFIFYNY